MRSARATYLLLQRLLRAATPLALRATASPAGPAGSKFVRALEGRRGAGEKLAAWGREDRDPGRPCAWFHAPSMGEGVQARAVMGALARRRPELQAVFTHLSPSAEPLASGMRSTEPRAASAGYLPWDLPEEVRPALAGVRPGVIAFTKTEVWPTLTEEALRLGVPVALVGGVVAPGALRSRWWARPFLRPTWRSLTMVAAVGEADAEGFAELGVPAEAIHVAGDPGVDAAAERVARVDPRSPWLRPFAEEQRPTLVAGSTWPSDLRVLLPALDRARKMIPELRLVLAPHEPGGDVVPRLLAEVERWGWRGVALARAEGVGAAGADAVVVDRVGVLAELYVVGNVGYVGGGFHGAGVHSVVEPAAAGLPVLFGPGHARAPAAGELAAAGGGREVADADSLADALIHWLKDSAAHACAAKHARGYVGAHVGAADRTAALLEGLLTLPPPIDAP